MQVFKTQSGIQLLILHFFCLFLGPSPADLTSARIDHRLDTTKSNTSHDDSDSESEHKHESHMDTHPEPTTFSSPVKSAFPRKISESDFVSSFDRNKSPEIHSHTSDPVVQPSTSSPIENRNAEEHALAHARRSPFDRSAQFDSDQEDGVHSKSSVDKNNTDSDKSSDRQESLCDSSRLLMKEHTSPPNVTVVQPSVTHPMFPYFYPHGYPSTTASLPYHMLLNQGSSSLAAHGLYLPSSHGDLNHLSPTHGLSAFGQLPMPGHPLYPNLSPTFTSSSSNSLPGSHLGPLFASRSNNRFSPYSFPMTKTTMATSASPHSSSGFNMGSRSPTSPSTAPSSLNLSRPSPVRSRSPVNNTASSNPSSELKSIERMLSGLDRKREIGPDSTGAIVEK